MPFGVWLGELLCKQVTEPTNNCNRCRLLSAGWIIELRSSKIVRSILQLALKHYLLRCCSFCRKNSFRLRSKHYSPVLVWTRLSVSIALWFPLLFLKSWRLMKLKHLHENYIAYMHTSSFTVGKDSCHGHKFDLQKVSKPFKGTRHYWQLLKIIVGITTY